MIKKCSLQEALDYENEDVIFRFVKTYNISEIDAQDLFYQTKKWLWLCYKAIADPEENHRFVIDDSLLIIDEMWHNFILFTFDYNNYCNLKFGFYIHHYPTKKNESIEWNKSPKENLNNYIENLKVQYSLIYDFLGEDTLKLWYRDYPITYSKDEIKKLIK